LDGETKYHKPARVIIKGVPHFHHTPCSFVLAPNTYEFAHYFHQALDKEALSTDTILARINRAGTAPLLRLRKRRPPRHSIPPSNWRREKIDQLKQSMMEMKEGESIPPATGYVPTVMDGPRPSISIYEFDRKNSDRRGHLYCQ
jgi:hypothetical protein